MTEATLFKFPCDFPLKVMGRRSDDFRSIVLGIGAADHDQVAAVFNVVTTSACCPTRMDNQPHDFRGI